MIQGTALLSVGIKSWICWNDKIHLKPLKFMFSKKATKIDEIFTIDLSNQWWRFRHFLWSSYKIRTLTNRTNEAQLVVITEKRMFQKESAYNSFSRFTFLGRVAYWPHFVCSLLFSNRFNMCQVVQGRTCMWFSSVNHKIVNNNIWVRK